jgi:hypothetical protein
MINYTGRIIPDRKNKLMMFGCPVNRYFFFNILGIVVPVVLGILIAIMVGGNYYFPNSLQFAIIFLIAPICPIFLIRPRLTLWMLLIFGNFLFFLNRFAPGLPMGMGLEALYLAAGFGTLLKASIEKRWPKANIPKLLVFGLIIYGIYYGFQIINPNSPGSVNSFYGFRWWLLPALVPWLSSVWLGNARDLRRFFIIWMILTTITLFYGVWQQGVPGGSYRFTAGELSWLYQNPTHNLWGTIRIFSTLGSADAMGMYMVMGVTVSLAMITSGFLPTWAKLTLFGFIPLAILVMLWTMTRSAYVALPVGIFTITLVTRNRKLVIFTSVLAVLYMILSVTGAGRGNVYIARFFTTTETSQDESYQVRQAIFDSTVNAVYDSPIGSGPNTTGANGQKTLAASGGDQADAQFAGTATDNYYLRIGLEAGWLGVLTFLVLVVCTIISCLLCYFKAKSRSAKYMIVTIIAVILSMLIGSWANNYFQYPPLTQIFFMSLGLIGPLRDIKEEDLMPPRRKKIHY